MCLFTRAAVNFSSKLRFSAALLAVFQTLPGMTGEIGKMQQNILCCGLRLALDSSASTFSWIDDGVGFRQPVSAFSSAKLMMGGVGQKTS